MSEIQELSISYYAKYYYKNVLADFSNTDINSLSTDKTLKLKETRLFIKAIVEGKANLYEYANTGTTLFLIYSEKNKQITHLVSKMYLDNDEIKINDIYKTQLEENFECPSISSTQISQITYEEDPLTDLFIDLNKCFDAEYTKYESIKSKTSLRVSVRGGVRNSSFEISSQNDNYSSVEFSGIQGYRAGVELELVIPSKQNNWSIFAEPLIQQQSYKTDVGDQTFKFEYNSVEVPFGVRYYLHLAKHLSVFGNGVFVGSFDFNSSIKGSNQEVINPRSYVNFGCGAGIKAGRIVAEYRYQGRRRLLTTYANITSSVITSYSIHYTKLYERHPSKSYNSHN